jgi:PAS domain S-box-containing protein
VTVLVVGSRGTADAVASAGHPVERVDGLDEAAASDDATCLVVDSDALDGAAGGDAAGGDGTSTAGAVRVEAAVATVEHLPVVVVGDGDDAEAVLAAGAADYVHREAPPAVLAARVESVLERRQRERRLGALFEESTRPIGVFDTDGSVREQNPAAERLDPDHEDAGDRIWNRRWVQRSSLDGDRVREAFESAAAGDVERITADVRDSEGEPRSMLVEFRPLREGGRVTGVVAEGVPTGADALPGSESMPTPLSQRLRTIVENVPVVLFALDAEGTFILSEGKGLERLGVAPGELVGESVFDVYDDDEAALERVRRALDGEHVDGTLEPQGAAFETWYRPVTDDDGTVVQVIGAAIDVTERKERERELERYRTLVEAVGDPMYVLDADGTIEMVNRAMAEYLGADREAVVGQPASSFLADVDAEQTRELLVDLLADPDREWATREVTLVTADGEQREAEINVSTLADEDGELGGSAGVVRDITERKTREQELEQYEAMLETVPDGVFIIDEDGYIVAGNDVAAEMFGFEIEDLRGAHISSLVEDGIVDPIAIDKYTERVPELLSSESDQETSRYEYPIYRDGERRIIENHIALRPYDEEFRGVVGINRDVTERERTELELRRQNERLEKLASVVSHDLRNPLNVAQGMAELLAAEQDDEEFDQLRGSLDRMEQLIDQLLELARTGRSVTDPEHAALGELAREAWSTVSASQATAEVDLDYEAAVDRSRVRQLFENLFRNAVDHGGPDVTVTVADLDDGRGFYVADDGTGVPPDRRDSVFEYGFSTAPEGTGLGLAIVREIAEAHSWTVDLAESEAGGARFEFRDALEAE